MTQKFMKKIVILFILWLLLVSCANKTEIDSAKQELLWNTISENPAWSWELDNLEEEITDLEEMVANNSLIQIIPLDANSPLEFNEISEDVLTTWEVVISGIAWPDVDKIEVFFTNPNSTFSDDRYVLQTYVKWEWDFKYIASSKNKVLDYGINEYIFRAYSGIAENETKIILEVPTDAPSKEDNWVESQLIGGESDSLLIDLPTSTKYGEPLLLWEDSFTYTQIKGLEIQKQALWVISCDEVTDYLTEKLSTWYFWNTCRDIVKDKWIKFNVIRLAGDEYIYERHYIDFTKWLYGTYELETGTGVDKDNIEEKNDELKEEEFPTIEIVDDLIKDILQA